MLFSRWPVYQRVLANLADGSAIDGVLLDTRGPLLVLGDATLLTDGGEPAKLDGEIYIERSKILFLQATGQGG